MDSQFIRNFVIMAHIDHGKSTLADRFFELTNKSNVPQPQFLDQMELEREKGITIKLAPLRMEYSCSRPDLETQTLNKYILNLIDTPGHVDFSNEVVRSLEAVEGALLLVDAAQGVQAQTLSNLDLAKKLGLAIIPVVNKIDLETAQVKQTKAELSKLLGCSEKDVLCISAKFGTNVEKVLKAIIAKIPAPKGDSQKPVKTIVFDAVYDSFQGVIAYIRVLQGQLLAEEKAQLGVFIPKRTPVGKLSAGEIGYQVTGIKDLSEYRKKIGYEQAQPMVFANIFGEFEELQKALSQLKLNDAALSFHPCSSKTLGQGFKCGFLGMLHLEITLERLKREYDVKDLLITPPSVNYKKKAHNFEEPWVSLKIIAPQKQLGKVWELLKTIEGESQNTEYLSEDKLLITHHTPLREIASDFYDKLKNASSGYASMSYEIIGYKPADLVWLDILVAGQKQECLSQLAPQHKAYQIGKALIARLKNLMPPQQFVVPLQAAVGGKILARENIKARRKDVTAGLYGGDYTRKRKQLEKQKKGKKKMAASARIKIPPEVFVKLFQKNN